MTFVVTESCIGCKYTDCMEPCPVDCFHEGPNFMVIDPEVCIDCAACVAECPVQAIFDAKDVPPEQQHMIVLNAEFSRNWPVITERHEPLPEAEQWADVKEKMQYLEHV